MSTAPHISVLRDAVIASLMPKSGGHYVDGTFGAGGYSEALLGAADCKVWGIDRDPDALAFGTALTARFPGRLTMIEGNFGDMDRLLGDRGIQTVDGVALDLGVSSMQLDRAERGFSFRADGPLDMRMGREGPAAAELVNTLPEAALADLLYTYGEERLSRRIAHAVVADRAAAPFLTTRPLAELVARLVPHKPTEIHPATRTFQALRIAVNDELGELVSGLAAAERVLRPGGKLAVVTFHSLEDRIVKQFFARRSGKGQSAGRRLPGEPPAIVPSFILPKRQPVVPGEAECVANPRARSAKLRSGTRTSNPPIPIEPALRNHALLPQTGKPS